MEGEKGESEEEEKDLIEEINSDHLERNANVLTQHCSTIDR